MSQSNGGFGGQSAAGQPGRWVPQGSQAQGSQYGQVGGPGQYGASYPSGQPGSFGQSGSYGAGGYPGGYPGGPVGPGQPPAGGAFGSGSSGRRGFPVWGWVLVAVAVVGVVVGILFATGVFGGGNKEADPTPTPSAVTESSPSSLSTTPSEDTTTPTQTATTPATEQLDDHSARVDDLTVETLEYNSDASETIANNPDQAGDEVSEGNKIVGVKVKVTNNGSKAVDPFFGIGGPFLYDSKGRDYMWFDYWGDGSIESVGMLSGGDEVEVWVYFEVPQDFSLDEAPFETWSPASYGTTIRLDIPQQ